MSPLHAYYFDGYLNWNR